MRVIGFTGKKRCGKDTASAVLVNEFNYKKLAFADSLKRVTHYIFSFSEEDLKEENKERSVPLRVYTQNAVAGLRKLGIPFGECFYLSERLYNVLAVNGHIVEWCDAGVEVLISPRKAYQYLGTDVCRSYKDDIWTSFVEKEINAHPDTCYVVSDVRFDNEAKSLKSLGGVLIEIRNSRVEFLDNHISEQGVDSQYIDYMITNDGTLDEFHYRVRELVKRIEEGE